MSWSQDPYEITPLSPKEAYTELTLWANLYTQAQQGPVAFFPRTAWEYLTQHKKNADNPNIMHEIHAFFAKPMQNGWIRGEGDNPYVQRCYPAWTPALFTQITTHAKQVLTHPKLIDFLETCCA